MAEKNADRLRRMAREQLSPEALEAEERTDEDAAKAKLHQAFDAGFAEYEEERGRERLETVEAREQEATR